MSNATTNTTTNAAKPWAEYFESAACAADLRRVLTARLGAPCPHDYFFIRAALSALDEADKVYEGGFTRADLEMPQWVVGGDPRNM